MLTEGAAWTYSSEDDMEDGMEDVLGVVLVGRLVEAWAAARRRRRIEGEDSARGAQHLALTVRRPAMPLDWEYQLQIERCPCGSESRRGKIRLVLAMVHHGERGGGKCEGSCGAGVGRSGSCGGERGISDAEASGGSPARQRSGAEERCVCREFVREVFKKIP